MGTNGLKCFYNSSPGIIQKKSASGSRTLPFVILTKKCPFFQKWCYFNVFLGNTSPKVPFFSRFQTFDVCKVTAYASLAGYNFIVTIQHHTLFLTSHLFSTYAKCLCAHQGVRNVTFSENFANVYN